MLLGRLAPAATSAALGAFVDVPGWIILRVGYSAPPCVWRLPKPGAAFAPGMWVGSGFGISGSVSVPSGSTKALPHN